MRPGAHIKAAVEVLAEVFEKHRPVASALSDWGKSHRFAGSSDRAAIGNLVYDALRKRTSFAAQMGADTPRAIALAAAPRALGLSAAAVAASADGSPHALEPLSADEQERLLRPIPADAPAWVRGDYPDWLKASFDRAFGDAAAEEGAALARRAPVDLRVNTLKSDRDKVLKALARFNPVATPLSPFGVRLPAPDGPGRQPNVEAEIGHGRGWYEVQDESSQIAALIAGAGPRQQVLDICAGSGGKTLALAAIMRNTGQIYAYDEEPQRLRPIVERLKRAGVRNAQVLQAGRYGRTGRARASIRSCLHRRSLHGHRCLAPQAGCQMAVEARQSTPAAGAAVLAAQNGGSARQAWRSACLRHLLHPSGGEWRPGRRVPREPFGLRRVAVA